MAELARQRLLATDEAPRTARALVADLLGESLTVEQAQVAQLLVSEIVTNALCHTPSEEIWIDVEAAERVRVSVTDKSHLREHHSPQPDENGGHGLHIVQELASDWGTETVSGNGKRVWFELS